MQFPGEWFAQEIPAVLPGLQRWFIFTSGSNKGEGVMRQRHGLFGWKTNPFKDSSMNNIYLEAVH